MLFNNFRRWLDGSFVCRKCGREFHAMFFGFGKAICPDCYSGERSFLFLDYRYWLNRFMAHLLKEIPLESESPLMAETIGYEASIPLAKARFTWLKRLIRKP